MNVCVTAVVDVRLFSLIFPAGWFNSCCNPICEIINSCELRFMSYENKRTFVCNNSSMCICGM